MRFGAFKAIFVKEVKLTFRRKSFLFWSIVFPIMLLTLMTILFVPKPGQPAPAKVVKAYVIPEERSDELVNFTKALVKYMSNMTLGKAKIFNVTMFNGTLDEALEYLRNGTMDAVIVVPRDAPESFNENLTLRAKIYVLTGTPNPTEERLSRLSLGMFFNSSTVYVRLAVLNWSLHSIAERLRGQPVDPGILHEIGWLAGIAGDMEGADVEWVEVKPKMLEEVEEIRPYIIGWMTISVVFMEFMFIGLLGSSSSMASEFEKGYMTRIISTRVRPIELYLGKMAAGLLANLFTSVLVVLWGIYALGAKFAHGLLSPQTFTVVLIMLVATLLSMSIGVLLGLIFRSAETAGLVANAIIWPTMMMGGFWMPKFMLPPEIRWFAEVNPMSNLMYAVVEVSSYGRSITAYLTPLAVTVALTVVVLAVSSVLFIKKITKLIEG